MENPIKIVDSVERIIHQSADWDMPGQLAAYATIKLIIREIEALVEKRALPGYGYILEKAASLSFHVGALYGIDEDNGHDAQKHRIWALGALSSIRSGLDRSMEAGEPG
ncbi:MAG TPA: hypothetical protein PLU30_23510 [Verrucomicrobiae bacterium]|nr:hypothetical protein [Verrucomicrobiae bacterium]